MCCSRRYLLIVTRSTVYYDVHLDGRRRGLAILQMHFLEKRQHFRRFKMKVCTVENKRQKKSSTYLPSVVGC